MSKPAKPRGPASRSSRTGKSAGTKAGSTRFINRSMTRKVKTARGRKRSSTQWLQRQLNDPYVAEARVRGYRSRAAFKLLEMDDRFHLLKPGKRVVDLGATPGSWTQVVVERVNPDVKDDDGSAQVVALDINEMEAVPGSRFIQQDFLEPQAPDILKAALNGPADVVLSDMAAPATGHTATDHVRIIALCELALEFAEQVLAPDGAFLAKVLQGGTENRLLARMKRSFRIVKHVKPPASRAASAEMYVIALGFRGRLNRRL